MKITSMRRKAIGHYQVAQVTELSTYTDNRFKHICRQRFIFAKKSTNEFGPAILKNRKLECEALASPDA